MKRAGNNDFVKKAAILTAAFLIFWLYLGSLINFHQYHIFGKALMPDGIMCKREESISKAEKSPSLHLLSNQGIISGSAVALPLPGGAACTVVFFSSMERTGSAVCASHSLRGPPSIA